VSSDSEKFECLRVLSEVAQYVHQEKRAPERTKKILQWILNESKQQERIKEHDNNMRAFIDRLILKVISGDMVFRLESRVSLGTILRYEKETETCTIIHNQADNVAACHLKAVLSSCDFENSLELPLNQEDKEFFFNLWLEKCRFQDGALLRRFTRDSSRS